MATSPVVPQQSPQTLAQMVRAKYPGAYDDMDDVSLEQKVLAKYPQYSDLPRSQPQVPNAVAQAQQQMKQAIPTMAAMEAASYPGARQGLSPFTAAGQRQAQIGENYNNYMRQSGQTAGTMAGAMATGGLFPAIKGAGVVQNILPFLGRTAASGAGMGAGALAGGATPQEAQGAAIGGAAGQPIAEGLSAMLPWLAGGLKKAALSQYQRALSPTTKINKAITQKITPELIDRGIYGGLEDIQQQAGMQAANLKPQLETAYGATPASATTASGSQILQDLENLKGKYIVQGMPANPAAVDAISGVQDVVKQYGSDIAPDSLRKLKQIFDDPVAARGGYAGADLATAYTLKAQKVAANSIRGIMSQASPDVAALNKEISFWLDVQRVTSQTGLRRAGQEGGLVRALGLPFLMAGGGAAGHMMGGTTGTIEGATAGLLTTAATLAIRSPAWRTASAVFKSRFADALARGSIAEIAGLSAKLGVALQGSSQAIRQANQTQPLQAQTMQP